MDFSTQAALKKRALMCLDLYPATNRAVGLGVCSVASDIGGILSPIILLLGDAVAFLPLMLFGSSAVLAGLLALLLPETLGRRLPQTLAEGEEMGKYEPSWTLSKDHLGIHQRFGILSNNQPLFVAISYRGCWRIRMTQPKCRLKLSTFNQFCHFWP